MLTSHKIKIIQSLDKKKFRQKYNLFLVESNKIIKELANSHVKVVEIFSTKASELENFFEKSLINEISSSDLKKISFLQNPKDSVALCELSSYNKNMDSDIKIVLDGVQDPGNLGTIVRLADWFGISEVVCSKDTVDLFNPKVLMSTMGSFNRVDVSYVDLVDYLKNYKNPIFGTDMDGENIYTIDFPKKFCLIMGNEGNGMRESVEKLLSNVITIPRFGHQKSTESLNVSMATSIILGQIFSTKTK